MEEESMQWMSERITMHLIVMFLTSWPFVGDCHNVKSEYETINNFYLKCQMSVIMALHEINMGSTRLMHYQLPKLASFRIPINNKVQILPMQTVLRSDVSL